MDSGFFIYAVGRPMVRISPCEGEYVGSTPILQTKWCY